MKNKKYVITYITFITLIYHFSDRFAKNQKISEEYRFSDFQSVFSTLHLRDRY
jgi:hypothetical protein